jgi:hypothetical protein
VQTPELRLQSLRLVGRVVVTFGLVLALTDLLVGRGTIYRWVLTLCWFAAIPVGRTLVRWWRSVIFERIATKRKKTPIEHWVETHQQGWASFVAATVGGALLAFNFLLHFARSWVGTFELSRRVLAYLFRREISKQAEKSGALSLDDLNPATYEQLGPESAATELVASAADEQREAIFERIRRPGGGVFAVVGARGMGKSTVVAQIQAATRSTVVQCPFGGMEQFSAAYVKALGANADASLESVAATCDQRQDNDTAILLDDAHRLILPMMGGLRAFDRVLALART